MKRSILGLAVALLFSCTPNGNSDGCIEPGTSCSNCYRVYDDEGNFVAEGGATLQDISWDGTNCKGNKVPCGKYEVEATIQGYRFSHYTYVIDDNTTRANGRSACDDLKDRCGGTYFEEESPFPDDVNCYCCQ